MPGIVNPAQGWLTNWNNNPIRGWSSADIRELWGTEHRVQALQDGILHELAVDGKLSVDDVNLVMYQAAKKDEYAGGRGAFDGRPAVAGPFAALSAAVRRVSVGGPGQADAHRRARPHGRVGERRDGCSDDRDQDRLPDHAARPRGAAHRPRRRRLQRAERRRALRALAADPPSTASSTTSSGSS